MKKLAILIVAVLFVGLTGPLFADSPGAEDEPIGGTVPWDAQWTFTATSQTAKMDNIAAATYDLDKYEITDVQVCTDLDSNDSLSIDAKIKSAGWTVPADYPTNGNKNSYDATSDFKILANNFAGGNITHTGTFNGYTLLTDTDQEIINSTATGAGGVGVENESFDIDCEIYMDWLTDPPGAYAITMTLTLVQEP